MSPEAQRLRDREEALLDRIEAKATHLADLDDQMHKTAREIDDYRALLAVVRGEILNEQKAAT